MLHPSIFRDRVWRFCSPTTGVNTTSRRRASLFIRNRWHRKAPTFRYFGSGRNICRISEPIPGLLIGCQTTLRAPEVIIPQTLRPSWPADSFMFCFRELIRKRIPLLSFIYLINAWRYIYKKQILTFPGNINAFAAINP